MEPESQARSGKWILKVSSMGFIVVGEPSRLARGARITGEIWKMDRKGSVAWDLVRWGSPPDWPGEPESQARSEKWI